jgi:flavin reductase (DIM6/NTAB) family NADH-FMN oxidoreductase RutF
MSRTRHVGVHLLAHGQQDLAHTFATSGVDRFAAPTRWAAGPQGVPILEGALAWLLCRVVDRVTVGDHAIVLAEPELLRHADVGSPLLYHRGRYAGVVECADTAGRRAA